MAHQNKVRGRQAVENLTQTTLTIADNAVTSAKINASAVTTAKINAAAVTKVKLAGAFMAQTIVTGADSSGGAADITLTGIAVGDELVSVINLTDLADRDKTKYTIGANKLTQAQSEGDLSAKKLLVTYLDLT